MPALIIDGKRVAAELKKSLSERVATFSAPATLAVVLVGDNPASQVYVSAKSKAAHEIGLKVMDLKIAANADTQSVVATLQKLSADPTVDGILLQLPLPKQVDEFTCLCAIDPRKDVDGLHPYNQGLLLRGAPGPRPCTPQGVIDLIQAGRDLLKQPRELAGLSATVIGRSILVGKPMYLLLLEKQVTVTICHSQTKNLTAYTKAADILIAAAGRPNLITAEMVKPGAIVIDVGINRLDSGRLCGDVDFDSVSQIAGAITPVPGGVGPMTIACLLANTVDAHEQREAGK
ncbi:bifunctional methylenetetrahydrofolate dehydrogenase/methenyltetrahydrofolate cyclohydrolase FolD [bacterium]|nr:bifunctional methylenetetrahydrofolate dehydrogenase/methenyltetrahydrofolate cyclohydrolase FolD [bacterium]